MPASAVPLQQVFVTCEALYQRDGFVRWADVARTHGLSRQAIQLRLRRAIELGQLDTETYDRWSSMSSRRTATAKRVNDKKQAESGCDLRCSLTPENAKWVRDQIDLRSCTRADIVNGLINKARTTR